MPSKAPMVTTPVPPTPVTKIPQGASSDGNTGSESALNTSCTTGFFLRNCPPSTVTNEGQKPFTHEKSLLQED